MIFDSHSHYDDEAFDNDRDELLSSFAFNNIGNVIAACAEWKSIDKIIALCAKYDFIHPALGIHPNCAADLTPEKRVCLENLIESGKPIAIGEIGLDYYYDEPSPEIQREAFIYQLKLAERFNLPVIIHSRDAAEETLEIMKEFGPSKKGVIHCFSSSVEIANEYVKMGYYIGIGGVVTFKNARKLKEVAAAVPLNRILLETDCPYLAPVPHRGERNSSLFLPLVADEIAAIRGINADEVISVTEENAYRLFDIR